MWRSWPPNGRRLLPGRDIAKEVAGSEREKLEEAYGLKERLFMLNIPVNSPLAGMTLVETRLGSTQGIIVIGILRPGNDQPAPDPLMMAAAISGSVAFLRLVGHSANQVLMGPGGYRFKDYTRVRVPLTMVVLVVVILVVPLVWPF